MLTPTSTRLSKSRFLAGLQCLKRLYLQVHQPELAGEIDEGQQAIFDQGHEVGDQARTAFPGGVLVESGADDLEKALARTATLLHDPSTPAIFEATFFHFGVLVRVDILQRRRLNRWRLIEVKSSVDCKEHYLYDVAIQRHVLRGCGVDISSSCVMHLNREYVFGGQQHDLRELFTIKDLTRRVARLGNDLPKLLKIQQKVLGQNAPPEIAPGAHCCQPYTCEFFDECNCAIPKNHVSFLPRLSEMKTRDLLDRGITFIEHIPENFQLTEIQNRVRSAICTGSPWVSGSLSKELSKLKHPLYFMDFESLYPAIPRYAGMRPYGHIPFQWSVDRQTAPEAEPEHFEFLAGDAEDPRHEFICALCEALGRRGSVVVYNAGFESQRLSELARWLPEFSLQITGIQDRLWDLLAFVRQHFYHPEFWGSYSLKSVLPALVPGLTYEGLEVAHGGDAGLAWDRMIRGGLDIAERQRLKSALLKYCGQDTLAMVKVISKLRKFPAALTARR